MSAKIFTCACDATAFAKEETAKKTLQTVTMTDKVMEIFKPIYSGDSIYFQNIGISINNKNELIISDVLQKSLIDAANEDGGLMKWFNGDENTIDSLKELAFFINAAMSIVKTTPSQQISATTADQISLMSDKAQWGATLADKLARAVNKDLPTGINLTYIETGIEQYKNSEAFKQDMADGLVLGTVGKFIIYDQNKLEFLWRHSSSKCGGGNFFHGVAIGMALGGP